MLSGKNNLLGMSDPLLYLFGQGDKCLFHHVAEEHQLLKYGLVCLFRIIHAIR